jgi:GMP synthase-like glutamine amidotransferase
VLAGLPARFLAGRYHSLVVDSASLPPELLPAAWTDDGVLMALAHRDWPVFGVQFHPESVLTPQGRSVIDNFLRLAGVPHDSRAVGLKDYEPPQPDDDFYLRQIDDPAAWPLPRN